MGEILQRVSLAQELSGSARRHATMSLNNLKYPLVIPLPTLPF